MVVRYFERAPGSAVFDACAAPGGKAIAMSADGFVAAADLRSARARRLRENLQRAGVGPTAALVADAAHPPVRPMPACCSTPPAWEPGPSPAIPMPAW